MRAPVLAIALMGLVVSVAQAAPPAKKAAPPISPLVREVIGFSPDSAAFGWWQSTVDQAGKARAELHVLGADGKQLVSECFSDPALSDPKAALEKLKEQQKEKVSSLKLGGDPGSELYKSGTALRTTFEVAGKNFKLQLTSKGNPDHPTLEILLARRRGEPAVAGQHHDGLSYSLNSVLLSKDQSTVAVIVKFTPWRGPSGEREFWVALAKLSSLPDPPPLPEGLSEDTEIDPLLQQAAGQLAGGNFEEARETLQKVLTLDPDQAQGHYQMARVLSAAVGPSLADRCSRMDAWQVLEQLRLAIAVDPALARKAKSDDSFSALAPVIGYWQVVGDPLTNPDLVRRLLVANPHDRPGMGVFPGGSITFYEDGSLEWVGPVEFTEDGSPTGSPRRGGTYRIGRDGTITVRVPDLGEGSFRLGNSLTIEGLTYSPDPDCGV